VSDTTKTPEALLQDALNAEQGRTKQLTAELGTEREARTSAQNQARAFEKERDDERAAHTKTKNELADANKLVDELTKQLSEPAGPKVHTATIGSGASAQTYRFVVPQFYFEGAKVKAEDVKNNSDVLKALVKAGAKVIELVPAKQ
jgi:hypothetical protein